jgi:hypothetical protein
MLTCRPATKVSVDGARQPFKAFERPKSESSKIDWQNDV